MDLWNRKTLTAKAMQEAGVPFFTASGSDFIEMYAGLGAKELEICLKKQEKCSMYCIYR